MNGSQPFSLKQTGTFLIRHLAHFVSAFDNWELQEHFLGKAGAPAAALLTCRLDTGRTHPIPMHMAHIAHPLLGDPFYGTSFRTKAANLTEPARDALNLLGRQALHEARLGFEHPVSGAWMEFESTPPDDMQTLLAALRGRGLPALHASAAPASLRSQATASPDVGGQSTYEISDGP
jgi:hypothetical protein